MTNASASGISTGTLSRLSLQRLDEETSEWENLATAFVQAGSPDLYLQSGQVVTMNDPIPGRYRLHVTNGGGTGALLVGPLNAMLCPVCVDRLNQVAKLCPREA